MEGSCSVLVPLVEVKVVLPIVNKDVVVSVNFVDSERGVKAATAVKFRYILVK